MQIYARAKKKKKNFPSDCLYESRWLFSSRIKLFLQEYRVIWQDYPYPRLKLKLKNRKEKENKKRH